MAGSSLLVPLRPGPHAGSHVLDEGAPGGMLGLAMEGSVAGAGFPPGLRVAGAAVADGPSSDRSTFFFFALRMPMPFGRHIGELYATRQAGTRHE